MNGKLLGGGPVMLDVIWQNRNVLAQIESQIADERRKLDSWLADAYTAWPDASFNGEHDAGYPNWGDVENLAAQVFDNRLTSKLSDGCVRSLLFFISRSDECGRIVGWLYTTTGTPLSGIGDLTYDDFIFLCNRAVSQPDDFCDYQLVACFQKLETLNTEDQALLKSFFHAKADSYTRRMVVHAFAKFTLADTVSLIEQLWATDDCEFAKISCLYSLEPFPECRSLFDRFLVEYQSSFPVAEADYRQVHMQRFHAIQAK
ncbi:MAG: hypothetical protein R3C59_16840 [Planctomycetaceae bacterium]